MKIALIQTNPLIGDLAGNVRMVKESLLRAHGAGCTLAVFPELTLCGAPPRDLLLQSTFLQAHEKALAELLDYTRGMEDMACVLGLPRPSLQPGRALFNSACVLHRGTVLARANKGLLRSDDVHDEPRYFAAGQERETFAWGGLHCALVLGEDICWSAESGLRNPMEDFILGAIVPDLLINIAASPYHWGQARQRRQRLAELATTYRLPLIHVNQGGGQGDLVFAGRSLFMDEGGRVCAQAAAFCEDMLVVDFASRAKAAPPVPEEGIEDLAEALVCGIRDYLRKSGYTRVVLGLSGGIDSALTAALACRALGADRVLGVALPSPHSAQQSSDDAEQLARNLGCSFASIPIQATMAACHGALQPFFAGLPEDLSEQNIQSRIRALMLMALANKQHRLLLNTGNKSELAVGYCTLYGDTCGSLAVLADVYKTQVYALAHWINRKGEIIPHSTLVRPPTAELKPGQLDQDDLPPYDILDAVLQAHLEQGLSIGQIASALQVERELVQGVIRRVHASAYKRLQVPPGIRVSERAFGPGRRLPVVHGFDEAGLV